MTFDFSENTPFGNKQFSVGPGDFLLFIGANGGRKTRLAVLIENTFLDRAHRISAHRALNLNPSIAKISEQDALRGLRIGNPDKSFNVTQYRSGIRWGGKAETSLLNDFDFLMQALFADQSNISLNTHQQSRAGTLSVATLTKFEKLVEIWDRILPHRKLHISGDDINVSANDSNLYSASNMSDGESSILPNWSNISGCS